MRAKADLSSLALSLTRFFSYLAFGGVVRFSQLGGRKFAIDPGGLGRNNGFMRGIEFKTERFLFTNRILYSPFQKTLE